MHGRAPIVGGGRIAGSIIAVWLTLACLLVVLADSPAGAQTVPSDTPSPSADPTPSPTADPGISPDPSPPTDPSPTPDPSFTPDPSPSVSVTTSPSPSPIPTAMPPGSDDGPIVVPGGVVPDLGSVPVGRRGISEAERWRLWVPNPSWGNYGTGLLDVAAARLRANGATPGQIARRIYRPFILIGPAAWSDSWGAPRFVEGRYHAHHGQDVLCRFGSPVLAVASGTIRYRVEHLGGRVAFLELPDGSSWFYAHLSRFARDLETGDRVRPGDVIGRCGTSGDATVPHVHFAFLDAEHRARNPMKDLIGWLRRAERRVVGMAPAIVTPIERLPGPRLELLERRPIALPPAAQTVGSIPPPERAAPFLLFALLPLGLSLAWAARRGSSRTPDL